VCNNSPAQATSPENGGRFSVEPILGRRDDQKMYDAMSLRVRGSQWCALKVTDVSLPEAATDADLGGSSKYSSETLENQCGEGFHVNSS
jgi:hypothetical protein